MKESPRAAFTCTMPSRRYRWEGGGTLGRKSDRFNYNNRAYLAAKRPLSPRRPPRHYFTHLRPSVHSERSCLVFKSGARRRRKRNGIFLLVIFFLSRRFPPSRREPSKRHVLKTSEEVRTNRVIFPLGYL